MGNHGNIVSVANQLQISNYNKLIIINPNADTIREESEGAQAEMGMIQIQSFKCLDMTYDSTHQAKDFQLELANKSVIITKYYQAIEDLQIYISNVIKIGKMLQIFLFDELKFQANQAPFISTLVMQINGFKRLTFDFVKSPLDKKIELLQFVSIFLSKVKNIYICPDFIGEGFNGFYVLNFQANEQLKPEQIFLGFLRWMFGENSNFQHCLTQQQMPSNMPIYMQQIYNSMHFFKTLQIKQISEQIKMVKDKMLFLMSKTDSFYACHFFKKTQKHASKSDWIFLKSKHELFFYNFVDQHACNGKLIRKKKKINIDQVHVVFDPQDLQILYVPQNSKLVVKASEFEFESSSSISDIEIKHKIPVKFKNCLMGRTRNGDYLMLQQNLYRYLPNSNKLIQQTKKVSDYIFLSSTRESAYFIIKLSIDIFRNGIRVFYKNEDLILAHTGDHRVLDQISSIRVDIRHVIFCIQVYKGVFVMMAAKNMWVLDLNFQCFFSFATITQIKKLTAISKGHTDLKSNDQVFTILNQPFKVDFDTQNDGNNASIRDNILHILGNVQGLPYYLKYSFVHRIGAIQLEGYQPLFVQSPFKQINIQNEKQNLTQQYQFNFHQQNSYTYKYRNWIFEGNLLIQVYDFKLRWEKTNYEVTLKIEKIDQTLKQFIQKLGKQNRKLSRINMIVLLYKIYSIYEYLFSNSITHRNISVNHICFTHDRQLKIQGWTEPPRNWHVSDFKDYLLTCFNIMTYNAYQKITDKIISKHEVELNEYSVFSQKIQQAFRQSKTIQKKSEIEKSLQVFKSYLQKQLANAIQQIKMDKYIFSFQYKTPRLSVLNTETQKMKKITIIPEQTIVQEFTFAESDKFAWNQEQGSLYIFTASHQFYELKIDFNNANEEKIILQDYQYLPQNVSNSTFLYVKGGNLFSFGGIKKQLDGKSTYCSKIFKFNWKSLSWDAVAEMPQSRINPHAVISSCGQFVYLIGGIKQLECNYSKIIKFNVGTNQSILMVDKSSLNCLSHSNMQSTAKLFHVSEQLCLFLYWHIEEGDYVIRYISYLSYGFSLEIRAKNYSIENNLPRQSISLDYNSLHLIRPYGKYSKITLNKLECATVKNETIYAI